MLRAVRFAARFAFSIEEQTYDAICENAANVGIISAERVRDELTKILTGPNAGRGLRLMHDTGLLNAVLPEVERLVGVDQPPAFHPEGDVFEHTCMMLDLARSPSPELAFAILLHDIGKPQTQRFEERIRFDEHDAVGAEIARQITERLRFSNAQTDLISDMVAQHMRMATARDMKQSKLRRLLAMPNFEDHLELHRLDCVSSHGKLDVYEFLRARQDEFAREAPIPPPLLTGNDLIALGMQPGPLFGQIIDAVQEMQLENELKTHEEAINFVRMKYLQKGRP